MAMENENPAPITESVKYNVVLPNYRAHPGQRLLIDSPKKRKIIRAGRRGGKTTGAAVLAVRRFLDGQRVLYAAPTDEQITRFWTEVKRALAEPLEYGVFYKNETNHVIEELGTERRIKAKTAWNADTLRGDYADLLILDEWQMMDETAWTEVGAPMMIDHNGDAVFIYTPPSLRSKSQTKARDPRHAAKLFQRAEKDQRWLTVHFSSHDNPYTSREGLEEITHDMSRLAYIQEIEAKDTDEVPGALWNLDLIEKTRVKEIPCELRRIVVGVDPSGSTTNEAGIVAAAEGEDGQFYVLTDKSLLAPSPDAWANAAVALYHVLAADRICGERNYGGDMVRSTIQHVDQNVSYKDVVATRGKAVRAEPICALMEQGRLHIVGEAMATLEEEMCTYVPGASKSPNRMDAMVWAVTELIGGGNLGLVEYLKSGRAQQFLTRVAAEDKKPKPAVTANTLGKIQTNDKTVGCPNCGDKLIQQIAGGQMRCQACGNQWWPNGSGPKINLNSRRLFKN